MRRLFAVSGFIIITLAEASSAASLTTWKYTGVVNRELRNELGFPVPIGAPVKIEIAFDPLSPDIVGLTTVGDYLMSGEGTNMRIQVGTRISTPIEKFRIVVVSNDDPVTDDQVNFLSFNSQGSFLDINFPGWLSDAQTQLFFRRRHTPGPIDSDMLPALQPNSAHFSDVLLAIFKDIGSERKLWFVASIDPIPEPVSSVLGVLAMLGTAALTSSRSSRHSPRHRHNAASQLGDSVLYRSVQLAGRI